MPQPRLKMRQIKEILRYHFELKLSNEKTANALKTSKGSVHNVLSKFEKIGWTFEKAKLSSETELEELLYPKVKKETRTDLPCFEDVEKELTNPNVTLSILHDEYIQSNPNGLKKSQFYDLYKQYKKSTKIYMRMDHKSGDKLFVDYSGDSFSYYDQDLKKMMSTELFVATWGASKFTFANCTHSQKQEDWVSSHVEAFRYFNCIPHAIVPDNLKSAVLKADLYEPTLNPLYQEMSSFYKCAILPARVRKPQDKGIVENHVLHLQRFLLGRLRKLTFFSLDEINEAIARELERFNDNEMKGYGGKSRRQLFTELDQPAALQIENGDFKVCRIKRNIRVQSNYHFKDQDHYYSVPFQLINKKVDIYQTDNILEVYRKGEHVCRHVKGESNNKFTTTTKHMPSDHQYMKNQSMVYFIIKAGEIGENASSAVKSLFENQDHIDQKFNAARGILKLADIYKKERLENACIRALHYGRVSYKSIKSILSKGLDRIPLEGHLETNTSIEHENLRGNEYYFNKG